MIVGSNVKCYLAIEEGLRAEHLNFTATLLMNEQLKINVGTDNEYRKTIKVITGMKQEQQSFENKQKKTIKMMSKKLHPTCDPKEIG